MRVRDAQAVGMLTRQGLGVAARTVVDWQGAVEEGVSGCVVMVGSSGVVVGSAGLVVMAMVGSSGVVVGSTEMMVVVMGSEVTVADWEDTVDSSLAVEVGCAVGRVTSEGVAVGSSLTVSGPAEVRRSAVVVADWNVDVSVVAEVVFENVSVDATLAELVWTAKEVTLEKWEVCKVKNVICYYSFTL